MSNNGSSKQLQGDKRLREPSSDGAAVIHSDVSGTRRKLGVSRRDAIEAEINAVVAELRPKYTEYYETKATTNSDERLSNVEALDGIIMKRISLAPLLIYQGFAITLALLELSNAEGFERFLRTKLADTRPRLDRVFDTATTFYGCSVFLTDDALSTLGAKCQLAPSEYATAPLVPTTLLYRLRMFVGDVARKTLLVSGTSGSGKTISVIGLGSMTYRPDSGRTAVVVLLPKDVPASFRAVVRRQRALDRATSKQYRLFSIIEYADKIPNSIHIGDVNEKLIRVDEVLEDLQCDAKMHLDTLVGANADNSELALSEAFVRSLLVARNKSKYFLDKFKPDVYKGLTEEKKAAYADTYYSILSILPAVPPVSCQRASAAILKAVEAIRRPIPAIEEAEVMLQDVEAQKAVLDKSMGNLKEDRNQSVLSMLINHVRSVAAEGYKEMQYLPPDCPKMNLVIFLDEMGDHPQVVRALCASFPIEKLELDINKHRKVSVWLVAGGTAVGCKQHPHLCQLFNANGGEDNRDIFVKCALGKDSRFDAKLAIDIDELLPAIDSNARLAAVLGRLVRTTNDIIRNATGSLAGHKVPLDNKGMLQMAAYKWKSLSYLDNVPSNEMFGVMIDALSMYLFPDSEVTHSTVTERTYGLLVDTTEWVYNYGFGSNLIVPPTRRYTMDPYLVRLLSMTCDIDHMAQSDTLEEYFRVVIYLLACAANDDKVLMKLLTQPESASHEKYSVGPITMEGLGEVKIPKRKPTTSVFRELPGERSKFLQCVAEGLADLSNTSSAEIIADPVESESEAEPTHFESIAEGLATRKPMKNQNDYRLAMKKLEPINLDASNRSYIACFRSPHTLPFADIFLFIGNTLLLIQVKDHDGNKVSNKEGAYIAERLKMRNTDGMTIQELFKEASKASSERVEQLKALWLKATGQPITSVRLCFAASQEDIHALECEATRVKSESQVNVDFTNTNTDIFLSAAGISFLKFHLKRKLRRYALYSEECDD